MSVFEFDTVVEETRWAVKPLIPLGQLVIFLAQAGVGKSLIVENLAINIVFGQAFCGFETIEGDVLVIDQDTPDKTLTNRLIKFSRPLGNKPKFNLFVESMQGHSLSDGTIYTIINDHPTVQIIIIDSLHSICGRLNPNYTSDMSSLAKLKSYCLTPDRTIIINHHISEKLTYTVDDLMTVNPHSLSMGNSAIIQQADTYYIVGATADNGITNRLYIRPIAKRVSIKSAPLIIRTIQANDGEQMEFENEYTSNLSQAAQDCLTLFRESPSDRTVKEVYESMGHQHGEKAIRVALAELYEKGILMMSRHKSNLFKYRLP